MNHKADISLFLQNHKIDIMLLSETHLTERSLFNIPYTIQLITDGTAHGGTVILIRNTISHHEMPKFQSKVNES